MKLGTAHIVLVLFLKHSQAQRFRSLLQKQPEPSAAPTLPPHIGDAYYSYDYSAPSPQPTLNGVLPTNLPSLSPLVPSPQPTIEPSNPIPTIQGSENIIYYPSSAPSLSGVDVPTSVPTTAFYSYDYSAPSPLPTLNGVLPTNLPSLSPQVPSPQPSIEPFNPIPTIQGSENIIYYPSSAPSLSGIDVPTSVPTSSFPEQYSNDYSYIPTPSNQPTVYYYPPTSSPIMHDIQTLTPTSQPTVPGTGIISDITDSPTIGAISSPSFLPTRRNNWDHDRKQWRSARDPNQGCAQCARNGGCSQIGTDGTTAAESCPWSCQNNNNRRNNNFKEGQTASSPNQDNSRNNQPQGGRHGRGRKAKNGNRDGRRNGFL